MARVLMVVNVDWFFLSHRLPIALGALQAGYDVHVATTLSQGREKLEAYGFKVHALEIDRSGAEPFGLVKLLFGLINSADPLPSDLDYNWYIVEAAKIARDLGCLEYLTDELITMITPPPKVRKSKKKE